jgi:hypothetical protein
MSAVARLLQTHRPGVERLRVLSASGQLGFGIAEAALDRGVQRRPHFIGCDMGSIDPGPFYLGSGQMAAQPSMVRRDLQLVLSAARGLDVPLIIGSAGTAGARPHLEATLQLLREVARDRGWSMRVATIASDVPVSTLAQAVRQGRLRSLEPAAASLDLPLPDEAQLRACGHRVAQCGSSTFERALRTLPDVLVAGRACDTAIFAALPQMLGYSPALSLHMAKIIECTSLCCEPGGRDAMLAELGAEDFILESMNQALRATPSSVAAHALYEQADPWFVEEPEGTLDLSSACYEAVDDRRTRVSGARYQPRSRPTLKVEGAARVGARAVLLAGVADPTLIARLQSALSEVEARVRGLVPGAWKVVPHVYGQGAVRPLPDSRRSHHEVGLVLEFLAEDAQQARAAASVFKQNLLHLGYPGRLTTGGNLAFAFTPSEIEASESYRFVLYHLLEGANLDEVFEIAVEDWNLQESAA